MFGKTNVTPIGRFNDEPGSAAASAESAVARLLDLTEHPTIAKWVQFPKALLIFLMVPGDPESGAFYIYDRRSGTWFWVDSEDDRFGGYKSRTMDNWSANVDFWTWSNLLEGCVLFRHGHSDQATAHDSLPDVVPLESKEA